MIQAYSRDPLQQYEMEYFTIQKEQHNSVCGDMVSIYLKLSDDGSIVEYSHAGAPQIFTQVAASLLAESIQGRQVDEVLTWDYIYMKEQGFEVSPRRKRSAVSALLAVRNAIHERKGDGIVDGYDDLL